MISALLLAFPTQASDAPKGFRPVDESALSSGSARPEAKFFQVSLEEGRVRIETFWERERRERAEAAAKGAPRTTVPLNHGYSLSWSPGDGVRVRDGWLLPYDLGEWGGGILLFLDDGKRYERVSGNPTTLVARTRRGVFALQSYAHLEFAFSRLVEIRKEREGWRERLVTDLHVPFFRGLQDGERLVYWTDEFVSTLETDGRQREIYRSLYGAKMGSGVRRKDGELWFGAERGALRLRPGRGGGYAAQWFAPTTG